MSLWFLHVHVHVPYMHNSFLKHARPVYSGEDAYF